MNPNQKYGYYHLEDDAEVLKRLKLGHGMSIRTSDQTFDQWLEANNQTRKLIYVP